MADNSGPLSSTMCNDRAIPTQQNDGMYGAPFGYSRGQPMNIQMKRTFSGDGTDVWSEFIRYLENISILNGWTTDMKCRVLITTLRGQAETFAYGLTEDVLSDYEMFKQHMDDRFGHKAMKESYIAEAKLRKKGKDESFRDFGQSLADLYRRAHPNNRDYVEEISLKTFMDNCSDDDEFRLAVKRTRPTTLQEAVTAAMQEECIRLTENRKIREPRNHRPIYDVNQDRRQNGNYRAQRNTNRDVTQGGHQQRRRCYHCNSEEHLLAFCPNRRPSRPAQSNQLNSGRPRQ